MPVIVQGSTLTLGGVATIADSFSVRAESLLLAAGVLLISGDIISSGTTSALAGQGGVPFHNFVGGTLRVTGTLENDGSIDIAGSATGPALLDIQGGATLTGTGATTIEGSLANAGSLILTGGAGSSAFFGVPGPAGALTLSGTGTNAGLIALQSGLGKTTSGQSSSITLSGSLDSTGTIGIDGGQDGFFSASIGAILNDTGTLTTSGLITVGGGQGGARHAGRGLLAVSGSLANAGTIAVAGGGNEVLGPGGAGLVNLTGHATNTGTILLQTGAAFPGKPDAPGGQLIVSGTLASNGSIDVAAGAGGAASLAITATGTVTGTGTLTIEGSLANAGTIFLSGAVLGALGDTPGQAGALTIAGAASNTGLIEIQSAQPETGVYSVSQRPSLTVTGSLDSPGTILIDGGPEVSAYANTAGAFFIGGTVTNEGTIRVSSPVISVQNAIDGIESAILSIRGVLTNTGTISIASGASVGSGLYCRLGGTAEIDGMLTNAGSLDIAADQTGGRSDAWMDIGAAGTVTDSGALTVEGLLQNAGTLILAGGPASADIWNGLSNAGSMTISGAFYNNTGGVFELQAGQPGIQPASGPVEIVGNSAAATVTGAIYNYEGSIRIDGGQDGAIQASAGALLTVAGLTGNEVGTIAIAGGAAGSHHASGGAIAVTGTLQDNDLIIIAGGDASVLGWGGGGLLSDSGLVRNFGKIQVQAGAFATWTTDSGTYGTHGQNGTLDVSGSLDNRGTLDIAGDLNIEGTVTNERLIDIGAGGTMNLRAGGNLSGPGAIHLHDGGTVDLAATTGVNIAFADPALLKIEHTVAYTGTLSGLSAGDEIEIVGHKLSGGHIAEGILEVDFADHGGYVFNADPALNGLTFHVLPGGEQDTLVADPLCFCTGTRIRTPRGDIAIEHLAIGDDILIHGPSGLEPAAINWIGRRLVHRNQGDPLRLLPIRIQAGALAPFLPERDLCVSPCHAILLDGILVQAAALVNGTTIRREHDAPEAFTYWHLELDTHALLLAEGVPAETFVDNADRLGFDNHAEHAATYRDGHPIPEMDLPRAQSARQLPQRLSRQLAARAAALAPTPSRPAPLRDHPATARSLTAM